MTPDANALDVKRTHELKTWPEFYAEIAGGRKTCELRRDDGRDFRIGDHLRLREWDPDAGRYTGREVTVEVTHIMPSGNAEFLRAAIAPGFVVMSFRIVSWEVTRRVPWVCE